MAWHNAKADTALEDQIEYISACITQGCITDLDTLVLGVGSALEQWAEDSADYWRDEAADTMSSLFATVRDNIEGQLDEIRDNLKGWAAYDWDTDTEDPTDPVAQHAAAIADCVCNEVAKGVDVMADGLTDGLADGAACARDPYAYYGVSRSDFY